MIRSQTVKQASCFKPELQLTEFHEQTFGPCLTDAFETAFHYFIMQKGITHFWQTKSHL
jgi:hypothetical protein